MNWIFLPTFGRSYESDSKTETYLSLVEGLGLPCSWRCRWRLWGDLGLFLNSGLDLESRGTSDELSYRATNERLIFGTVQIKIDLPHLSKVYDDGGRYFLPVRLVLGIWDREVVGMLPRE